jgi:hypothetical protein
MAAVDWNTPTNSDDKEDVLNFMNDKLVHTAQMSFGSDTNIPSGAIDYDTTGGTFRRNSSGFSAIFPKTFTRRNMIIGGDFSTNPWQRGTTFAAIGAAAYCADRFQRTGAGGTATASQATDAPTVAQAGKLTNHSLKILCTSGAAIGADRFGIVQKIEGYNFLNIAQRTFTISFWVRSNKTGIYSVGLYNTGLDRWYVSEYTISVADTWEKKTIVVSASPSAGTWNYTNGIGLYVEFVLAAGVLTTSTLNSWESSTFKLASTNQVNLMSTTNQYWELALLQIEEGAAASPFEVLSVQETLNLCHRYYASVSPGANSVFFIKYDANTVAGYGKFPVQMRSNPTVTVYNSSTSGAVLGNASGSITGVTAANINVDGFGAITKTAGFGADQAATFNFKADAEL